MPFAPDFTSLAYLRWLCGRSLPRIRSAVVLAF